MASITIVARIVARNSFRIHIHLLCDPDQVAKGTVKFQSGYATAVPARCGLDRRAPKAKAIAINFTPVTAAPRQPSATPTHGAGSVIPCAATTAGATASKTASAAKKPKKSTKPEKKEE